MIILLILSAVGLAGIGAITWWVVGDIAKGRYG